MPPIQLSREELFALVWEKPTREVAKEFGVSDVAIAKLCARLQVPKPPPGYWARVKSGQTPKRPPLSAFREEVDRKRREKERAKSAETLSKLEQQFYKAALRELTVRGVDVGGTKTRDGRLPELHPDLAAQILLLIQNRGHDWVKEGKVVATWNQMVQNVATKLVGRLLPLARPQLLIFESEDGPARSTADGPAVVVRLTAHLQERIGSLVRVVRDQKLDHVVLPLMAADNAWSARYHYAPAARFHLNSTLCVSATEVWVESARRAWRHERLPERIATGRLKLRDIMPIDYMPVREIELPAGISRATVKPYRQRLQGFLEADRVYKMLSHATYAIEREVPDDKLLLADRIWFGKERPFCSAREAWARIEDELADWETELEAERSALAQSILGIEVGDIVAAENHGRFLRLHVTEVTLYASDNGADFTVSGTRFRKDGTMGKLQDRVLLNFRDGR